MNFREYIQAQPDMRGPLGDFVRDAKDDREFPDVASRAELLRYLDRLHACEGAVEAAQAWWKRYTARKSEGELYRHLSATGELLYVGISLSSLRRLMQHKGHSHWFHDIARVEIERHPTRAAALQAEKIAIIRERPCYNVVGAIVFSDPEGSDL